MRAKTLSKRKLFLQTGKELFYEKGYINVSVKEICQKINTTTGSFYFIFNSKEMLLEELLIDSFGKLWDANESISHTSLNLKEKLNIFFQNSLDFVIKEIELMKFYQNILKESGIGSKTAEEIKKISLKKEEETLFSILHLHKDEISCEKSRLADFAKYIMLILENKQMEFINKMTNNETICLHTEKKFLNKAITGLMEL